MNTISSPHFHALRVSGIRLEGEDAKVLSFDVPAELTDRYRFDAGQYLTLKHGELRRSYSICAAPGEPLRVGVRRVPEGTFSSWLHEQLKVGDSLDVMEPQGRFGAAVQPQRLQQPQHVLAVAGGSGITPILSILKAVLSSNPRARCTLLYGNRRVASTMFKEELEDLKNRYLSRLVLHPVFSREEMDSPIHSGRLDADKIHAFLKLAGPVDQAFVCGPHALNDVAEAALLAAGVLPERIHVERFGVPPSEADKTLHAAQAGDATTALITVVRDGLRREVAFQPSDESILAAAGRTGLEVPFSCRSGVCATCRAKVLEGRVRMDRNFALEKSEVEAGFVLTCQAHPLTDRVVISFDER